MKNKAKAILAASAVVFSAYAYAENKLMLNIRREKIGESGIRILQISDLHKRSFGKYNLGLEYEIAEKTNPDLIFITGDIISRTETNFSNVRNLIYRLSEIAPVYMINGNHEQSLPIDAYEEFIKIPETYGVKYLRNSSAKVRVKGKNFRIFGVEPKYTTYKRGKSYRHLDEVDLKEMNRLLGECPENDEEIILLAHNPKFADAYAQWGADYTFSGHVHGGIVRIFGTGLLSPERKFLPKYTKGIYDIGRMKLFVTSGLGKLRLFNPPEIVMYEL